MKPNYLYILGTALAIAFTMVIAEVYYVQVADVAPEVNRSTTLYCDAIWRMPIENERDGVVQERTTIPVFYCDITDIFSQLKSPECITAYMNIGFWQMNIRMADGVHDYSAQYLCTDPDYFKLYRFRFLEGRPFNKTEMDGHERVAVITRDLADRIVGKDQPAAGHIVSINNYDWRVVGVVETPPIIATHCSRELFVPYMAEGLLTATHMEVTDVAFMVCLSVPHDRRDDFWHEVAEIEARYNMSLSSHDFPVYGLNPTPIDLRPSFVSHYGRTWNDVGNMFDKIIIDEGDAAGSILYYAIPAILLLMLVPALNLSGMVASRMQRRQSELAVRRAFGARKGRLLWEVLSENMMQTLIGGAIGLVVAWIALYMCRAWIFTLFIGDLASVANMRGSYAVTSEMLFAPSIFIITFITCFVLNVLATTLPAVMALRRPIVESLNQKQ